MTWNQGKRDEVTCRKVPQLGANENVQICLFPCDTWGVVADGSKLIYRCCSTVFMSLIPAWDQIALVFLREPQAFLTPLPRLSGVTRTYNSVIAAFPKTPLIKKKLCFLYLSVVSFNIKLGNVGRSTMSLSCNCHSGQCGKCYWKLL